MGGSPLVAGDTTVGSSGKPSWTAWLPWPVFVAEMAGTALMLLGGLSAVILIWGDGSPIPRILPDENIRRLINGFAFGSFGAAVAISPLGARSGAHLNPVVTLTFVLFRRLDAKAAAGYLLAQMIGALLGSLPLVAFGEWGRSVAFGATIPGAGYSLSTALLGEALTTFMMISLLCVFLGFRHLRPFTPALFPPLYAVMVWTESPISGTSTNPARSFGPSLISGVWDGWWIFWAGPLIGTLAACLACSFLAKRITVAKLYYFDTDRDRLFRSASRSPASNRGPS